MVRLFKIVSSLALFLLPLAFAYAGVSLSVQSLSPSSTVSAGTAVSFNVAASGFSGPIYAVSDSFSGATDSTNNIDSNGNFIWTPTNSDVGTHSITVSVSDSQGNSASVEEQITVTAVTVPSVSVQGLSSGSYVTTGSPVVFTVAASGFSTPAYTLGDSFSGSTISNADINLSGAFSWNPTASDLGLHTITIYVTDSSGHSANVSEQLTVQNPSITVTSVSPSANVTASTPVTMSISAAGFSNPAYTLGDSFGGTSLSNANISSAGYLTWTPGSNDVGTHLITISATDANGHSANTNITVNVSAMPLPETGTVNTTAAPVSTAALSSTNNSANPSGYVFDTYLYPGITSDEVTELQTVLTNLGLFSGLATGYFGSLTEASVEAFQAAHGLDQLGVVGPATRAALNSLSGNTMATPVASTAGDGYVFSNFLDVGTQSDDVTHLQTLLTTLGLFSGPVTGYYGALTEAAVEQFQAANGIEQVGYVGPATREALNR